MFIGRRDDYMPSEDNKRIAKNTIFLYIRMLFTMGVGLYTTRIVFATLGIEDSGTYNAVGGVVAMFSFLSSSLAGGTQRFLAFELGKKDFDKLKKTFSAALNIHILLAIVIFILAETIGLWFLINTMNIPSGRENAVMWVYQFSILTICVSIIQVPFHASIIAHERMSIYAFVSIIDVILKLLIVYLLSVSGYDKLITFAVLSFLVSTLVVIIYFIYCIREFCECHFRLFYEKSLYTSILSFSGWSIMGCGAVVGATHGVNILLNIFFYPAINAARWIAITVNNAITAFVNNFQTAVNPQIIKLYAGEKREELHKLLLYNSKFSFCIMWILALPIFLKIEIILSIWLEEVPEYCSLFCRLVLIQSMIYCTQRPFVMACHAIGKMRTFELSTTPVLLLILPLSYIFFKWGYPVYIPFVIYIITTIIEFIIEIFLLRHWIALSFIQFCKLVLSPVFTVILTSLPLPFIMLNVMDNSFISFLIIILLSFVNTTVSVYFFALDKSLRNTLIRIIRTKILLK